MVIVDLSPKLQELTSLNSSKVKSNSDFPLPICVPSVKSFVTPCFIIPTSRGLPKNLTLNQLFPILESCGAILSIPLNEIVFRKQQIREYALCQNSDSLARDFFSIPKNFPVLLSFRDCLAKDQSVYGGDASLQLSTVSGRFPYTVTDHVEVINWLKPQLVVLPGEEICTTDVKIGVKRQKRSVESPTELFTKLIEAANAQRSSTHELEPSLSNDSLIHTLWNLQGGASEQWRRIGSKKAEDFQAKGKQNLFEPSGVYIGGLGYDELLSVRSNVLMASTISDKLSMDKLLHFLTIPGSPIEVLQAIWHGIDMIEIWFPFLAAEKGIALSFTPEMNEQDKTEEPTFFIEKANTLLCSEQVDKLYGCRMLKLGESELYKLDLEKLTPHSPCKETRSYIHHLLNCKEMLACQLLCRHNLDIYCRFINEIRRHLDNSRESLAQYIVWFVCTQLEANSETNLNAYTMASSYTETVELGINLK